MIEITVDSRIRIPDIGVQPAVMLQLFAAFNHSNPQYHKARSMGFRYTKEPKSFELARWDEHTLTVPRGGMDRVRTILDLHRLEYDVIDNRSQGDQNLVGSYLDTWNMQVPGPIFPEHKLVLWEHQEEMVQAIVDFQQGIFRSPTGSGKSSALLAAIARIQLPSLVIMWDTGLLKQWQERIEAELGIPAAEQGLIQGKNLRLKPITLAMQQTLHRWSDEKWSALNGVFGLVACDEVQRYAANTFTGIVDRCDSQYRVGMSASEKRKDKKHFLIYDMFGEVRHETTKSELIEKRIIHDVEVMVVPTGFAAPWYLKLKEDKNDPQHMQAYNMLLDKMQSDKERNDLVLALIRTAVEREGLDTLVFAHRTEHCQRLDTMVTAAGIKSGLLLGGKEWEDTFDETINGLRDGTKQVGVGTFKKMGVGHDIPSLGAGIAATPVHSNREFLDQVKGRICRKADGKLNARIYVLWDRLVFGDFPLNNLRKWNPTVKVWDEVEKKWLEASRYLKDKNHGEWATKETIESGIFVSAN